ncbi:IPT/TIG domain-containing protein [Amycolatopsis sp. H20-H5]|uniref:IPT/TIG domain-containing protein n=1 Tax=Amycolatopsis sp. H20-H5 TaxID=3046309 RepID=UPI002DBCBA28|nr:IPT/TIG domain-containing protein [Amycolatopsis sp. H20-H5]MEC3982822.1 IPT/TIG domain-containing protein [Amycolatopsis sp. H20-H5]
MHLGDLAVLAAAGLRPPFQDLTTSKRPKVALATPTCTSDVLISGSGFAPDARVSVGGREIRPVTYIGTNHLAVTLPLGSAGGEVSVTTRAGTSAADVDANSSLCSGLSTHSGNNGVSPDSNPAGGNIDGFGYSLSAEALAAKGFSPGSLVNSHGVTFAWPTASAGQPDNALAAGQTFGLIGSSATLGFLATSTYAAKGTGTVNVLSLPDWANPPPSDVDTVATLPYRDGPGGRGNRDVHLFYVGVPIDPHKTVKSVQLPMVGSEFGVGVPSTHIFAAGLAGSPDLALGKIATQSSEAYCGSPSRGRR